MEISIRTSANIVYTILCLLGLIWQVVEVSKIYFTFDVVTRVEVEVPKSFEAPALHACYRYVDLLDYNGVNQELKTNWKHKPFDHIGLQNEIIQQRLTPRQILKFTPSVNDSLIACYVRRPNSFEILWANQTICHQMFEVTKFVVLGLICYRYEYDLMKGQVFSLQEVSVAPISPGLMLEVSPGNQFNHFIFGKFLVTSQGTFPMRSMALSQILGRPDGSDANMCIRVTYFEVVKHRMPPPFKTNCLDYMKMGQQSHVDCHQRCVKNLTETYFKKIPFSSIESKSINKRVLSYMDVINQTASQMLFKYYAQCDIQCKREDCHEILTFSRFQIKPTRGIKLQIRSPIEPSVRVFLQTCHADIRIFDISVELFWHLVRHQCYFTKSTESIAINRQYNQDDQQQQQTIESDSVTSE